jgi:hypothetical protein
MFVSFLELFLPGQSIIGSGLLIVVFENRLLRTISNEVELIFHRTFFVFVSGNLLNFFFLLFVKDACLLDLFF